MLSRTYAKRSTPVRFTDIILKCGCSTSKPKADDACRYRQFEVGRHRPASWRCFGDIPKQSGERGTLKSFSGQHLSEQRRWRARLGRGNSLSPWCGPASVPHGLSRFYLNPLTVIVHDDIRREPRVGLELLYYLLNLVHLLGLAWYDLQAANKARGRAIEDTQKQRDSKEHLSYSRTAKVRNMAWLTRRQISMQSYLDPPPVVHG